MGAGSSVRAPSGTPRRARWSGSTSSASWCSATGPGEERAVALPTPLDVGSVAVRRGGGLVAALADGFWLTEPDSEDWIRYRPVEADRPDLRFNDGKCDPVGPVPGGFDGLRQAHRGRGASTGSIRTGPSNSSSRT